MITFRFASLLLLLASAGCSPSLALDASDLDGGVRSVDGGVHSVDVRAWDARTDAFRPDAYSLDDAFMRDAFMPQPAIDLRSAATFAVLSGSTVTSTGQTRIRGDLGISAGTALTGFPPATLDGTLHLADPIAAQAQLDLTSAYNDAAARSTAPITVAGNLGGMTLPPGLYRSASSLAISSGTLTLDGGGDRDAVWIFQMASTFTMTSGRQIILAGGARATNIYWQVGTSATLGSNSTFAGNILSDQSITVETGARVDGRVLTRIGAVTLDSNIIELPAP